MEPAGGCFEEGWGKKKLNSFLPLQPGGLVFEVATVSMLLGAGLLPCLLSVLAGSPASGRIYLSKHSFYLGCVSRVAGVEGGAGCRAPLGHPVSRGSPASPAASEHSVGWPRREPFPWVAMCPVCLAQAKLSMASISRAAFCCLLCPRLCANNPG